MTTMTELERATAGTLAVQGVSKAFGGLAALTDVSVTFAPGVITGIIGPNGAGKTTLFNVMTGFLRPDAGSVSLDAEELVGLLPSKIVARRVARTFQAGRLFENLSVYENVAAAVGGQAGERLGRALLTRRAVKRNEQRVRERVEEVLDAVGLAGTSHVLPPELSNAERRLLAIARLLAADAQVLLLDEPLAGLDEKSIERVAESLRALREEQRTIVLIEHNFEIIRSLSDLVLFMAEGTVVFVGSAEEIVSRRDLAELYFGR